MVAHPDCKNVYGYLRLKIRIQHDAIIRFAGYYVSHGLVDFAHGIVFNDRADTMTGCKVEYFIHCSPGAAEGTETDSWGSASVLWRNLDADGVVPPSEIKCIFASIKYHNKISVIPTLVG
jgi:hypothetical protein